MKKTLLLVACILLGSIASFGQAIPVDQYGNILLSDYENYADNQTVKIVLSISNAAPNTSTAVGYGVGTINPINKAVTTNTEDWTNDAAYNFSCKAVSEAGSENVYDLTIADLKNFAKVNGEYYVDSYDQKGLSINLYNGASLVSVTVEAAPQVSAVFDFEANTLGDTYSTSTGETAEVVANPVPTSGNAQSLFYQITSYDQIIILGTVTLPESTTLADYEKLTFDVYTSATQYKELLVKIGDNAIWGNGQYKPVSIGGAWGSNSINLTTGVTTYADGVDYAKTGNKGETAVYTDGSLTSFVLAVGVNDNAIAYYLDNVKLVAKQGSGIAPVFVNVSQVYNVAGGIAVNANNEKVSVYGIDGRLVKQTVANNTTISLAQGLYIVKVGADKAVKVLVK
jgi:hypothetical protein